MRQVKDYPLWIGHAGDGSDFRHVFDAGIRAIVQVAYEEPPLHPPRELHYCRFPLIDGPDNEPANLSLAITTLANLLEKGIPTLVCCGAGMSRSPAIAAAALSMVYQQSPEDCLKQVAGDQPMDVAPGCGLG
jgi:protein-tyrosine phosphatase